MPPIIKMMLFILGSTNVFKKSVFEPETSVQKSLYFEIILKWLPHKMAEFFFKGKNT